MVIVVITLVIGVWFFVLRGDGGATSEFLGARDRIVEAGQAVEAAAAEVERFNELQKFEGVVDTQRRVMQHQLVEFERLADEQGGDRAQVATDAAGHVRFLLTTLDGFAAAIIDHRLADAASALAQMQAYVGYVQDDAAEWNKLH